MQASRGRRPIDLLDIRADGDHVLGSVQAPTLVPFLVAPAQILSPGDTEAPKDLGLLLNDAMHGNDSRCAAAQGAFPVGTAAVRMDDVRTNAFHGLRHIAR